MRVISIIIILILSNTSLSAQSLPELKQLLSNNSLSKIDRYIILTDSNHLGISYWIFLREIAPDYFEGVARFNIYVPPSKRDADGHNYTVYRLSLLSHKDSIIYYKIEKQITIRKSDRITVAYNPILIFDNNQMAALDSSFTKTYHVPLNKAELFIDSIVYGRYCGFAATIIPQRRIINMLVKENNTKELQKLLRSSNTEKQLYAVDGLLQQKQKGYKIESEILELMNYIIRKSGTIQTCEGCIQGSQEISKVIKLE